MSFCLILLSGGLDSLYALVVAKENGEPKLALSFDYGQKSRDKEISSARRACSFYNVEHRVIDLPFLSGPAKHPLFDEETACPDLNADQLDDRAKTIASAKAVWVPNRNGVFLNVAAAIAEARGITEIYAGFNAEEGVTFPDNSAGFVTAVNDSLAYSTLNSVAVIAPALNLTKTQIVAELRRRDFDFTLVWSCYLGGETMCGQCESCLRLKRALSENGENFPTFRHSGIWTSAQTNIGASP